MAERRSRPAVNQGIGMTSMRTRARMIERLRSQGISNADVLRVMADTPRHLFVEEALASRAYEDSALPIGLGQTLSQPWTVARMSEAIVMDHGPQKVLEIGTGSGYQSAILSALAARVYSVERLAFFFHQAQLRFHQLGLDNIFLRHGDGMAGWAEFAPYDAILVTAAADTPPQALLDQLVLGGYLVMPVGGTQQQLVKFRREAHGVQEVVLGDCRFVPMLSGKIG